MHHAHNCHSFVSVFYCGLVVELRCASWLCCGCFYQKSLGTWFKWECISLNFGASCSVKPTFQNIFAFFGCRSCHDVIFFNKLQNVFFCNVMHRFWVSRSRLDVVFEPCRTWELASYVGKLWPIFVVYNRKSCEWEAVEHTDYYSCERLAADARNQIRFFTHCFLWRGLEHALLHRFDENDPQLRLHFFLLRCLIIISNLILYVG